MKAHQNLKHLVQKERTLLTKIIDQLQIINDQKYFLELGYKSMLDYCVKELKYSESAAYRRLKLIKLVKAVPNAKKHLETGALNLTQASTAQSLFDQTRLKDNNKKELILKKILNKSSKDTEILTRKELKLPARKIKLEVEISQTTKEKWLELKERTIHLNLSDGELLNLLFTEKLTIIKKEATKATTSKSKYQRTITANTRKFLMKRSQHRCEFLNTTNGKTCSSLFGLEIDHIRPINQGGQSNLENLRVLCREHNQKR